MTNENEVLKAFEDRTFAEKIFQLTTIEEVQKAFKEDKNLELSFEDLEELKSMILQSVERLQKGEITEEELLSVAGGKMSTGGKIVVGALGATALVGAGFIAGHNVDKYKEGGWKGFFSGVASDMSKPFFAAGEKINSLGGNKKVPSGGQTEPAVQVPPMQVPPMNQ